MRKPRYQNEDIMKALGIKTEEERKKYNDALIDEAYLFVDDEVEGYYRCLWGLTTTSGGCALKPMLGAKS